MPSLTLTIKHNSDMERKILREVKARVRMSLKRLSNYEKKWKDAEERVLAYMPERDVDTVRRTSRENGLPQYTTIQVPYTYAVLMSMHTYLTSVFMGRSPILQFSGRHGETSQQIQAMEALHDYQMQVGRMLGVLYSWLYDAGKYGVGVIGSYWDIQEQMVTSIEMQPTMDEMFNTPLLDINGQPILSKIKSTKRIKGYQGNCLYNLQPWDFIWDVNFPIREFQRGGYCGSKRLLTWNECKRREALGYYINLEHITKRENLSSDRDDITGSFELDRPSSQENWDIESFTEGTILDEKKRHPLQVRVFEIYIDLIPSEWGLGKSSFPEKWIFTCTDDYSVLLGAQPHGAYHSKYPFHAIVTEPEAYGLIPRGIPKILEPVQHTIDWLINSHFYNVRAALNNKFVVDPSLVVMKDVLDPLPGGIIRLKPEAYGKDVKTVMTQMNVTDITQNHLRDLQVMYGMGERTVGINDQIMGMLNTGGRKTATEIRTSTTFGVNRLKTIAEFISATGFSPLAEMLVQNTQQYYDGEQVFKIAGDLVLGAGPGFMQITPELITGFYDFVPVDGALPVDKFALANMWRELMMQVRQLPEVALKYDFGRMFEWVAQLAGLKNITQFKAQVVPDEMAILQAKLGNIVPMGGGRQQRPSSKPNGTSGNPEPGQVPGMGATI